MTNDHKMALVCFLAHINDVEAESSHCFVTVETVAEAVGCGNTKAEGIIKQLRAVGLMARKTRTATSTQTYLYRTPSCWERQTIDEAPDDQRPAEPVQAAPQVEEPKPRKAEQVALSPALDKLTEQWLKAITKMLSEPEMDEYSTFQVTGVERSYHFDTKAAADRAIALLADCLLAVKRIARPLLQNDRWYVMAIQRPEMIASNNLTEHYGREITVDRLPKINGVDEFGVSCAMMRLFDPETQLYQRYVSLFGRGLRNPAGQLVTHVTAIVRTDASISRGFPFRVHDPNAGQSSQDSSRKDEDTGKLAENPEVSVNQDYEVGCDDVDSNVIDPYDEDESREEDEGEEDEEPRFDDDGEIIPRYSY